MTIATASVTPIDSPLSSSGELVVDVPNNVLVVVAESIRLVDDAGGAGGTVDGVVSSSWAHAVSERAKTTIRSLTPSSACRIPQPDVKEISTVTWMD